ncbi:glycosyltransferase family 39 protein [Kineococcus gynurae]|uniref:Glycosyltransferase family 39 protein n=1 Tax=Kineococcus gynurae TaxID=452979 RepID=A0ABV5LUR2_9ACTN
MSATHSAVTRPPGRPRPGDQDPGSAETGRRVFGGFRGFRRFRVFRGTDDPAWYRPAVLALLAGTAALYLVGLSASGWANAFYSAAAQAGSVSWEAFFFGSSDAANSITVDKPPLALWLMALSVRAFGLSSFSILLPQALLGVTGVGILTASVRRSAGPVAGLLAGVVLASTPVATLMFRFNNPDALLVTLMVGAAAAVLRSLRTGRARWFVLAGVLLGLGFLTKQLQVFLVVPGLALTYLWAAPHPLGRRLRHVVLGGSAMVAAAGWWIALVELVPAANRPWIGGSQDNSILELTLGYNGFGRLTGDETGSVGAGSNWGETGLLRMFGGEFGAQASWLLPAALVLLVVGLRLRGRAPRTDGRRAAYLVWGGWTLVTGLTFSLMSGIIHPYYAVALAPGIAALVGTGASDLYRSGRRWSLPVLAGVVLGSTVWAFLLMGRSADFLPWLRGLVLTVGLLATGSLLAGMLRSPVLGLTGRALRRTGATLGLVAALTGPVAWSVQTAATPHSGAIVSAGPASSGSGFGGPGGGTRGGAGGAPGGTARAATGGMFTGGTGAMTPGGMPGGMSGGMRGGMGGLLDTVTPSAAVVETLGADADSYDWVAATIGSNNAAGYQLAMERPVMAVGGFNGTDPSPTLARFQQLVAEGRVHYWIAATTMASTDTGGSDASVQIQEWVEQTFPASTVDGTTVYDLSSG